MPFPPFYVGHREVHVSEREARSDIREREAAAEAELVLPQFLLHRGKPPVDLVALALKPRRLLLLCRGFAPLVIDVHGSIGNSVAQRFPAPDFDALGQRIRYEPRPLPQRIEVLHDDRRVVEPEPVAEPRCTSYSCGICFSASTMRTLRA